MIYTRRVVNNSNDLYSSAIAKALLKQPEAFQEAFLRSYDSLLCLDHGSGRQISVKRIGGSGDCLFAAIAQGHQYLTHGSFMRTPEERTAAARLRQAVCAELVRQKDMMEPFIGDVEPYARTMSRQGVWGGEPELAMASRCLKRRIHVFQPDVAGLQAIAKYGEDFHPDTAPITLLYNGINHYDLMLIDA
ncbi:hypothetical protein WJX73_004320 [Symbiochloris irregularis]|uniref:Ubiquitin thioesterase OTU n=1 Tax=Symbiochloris irregularis TaxID=706552 RepID=A0AAW1PV19_9CHLO